MHKNLLIGLCCLAVMGSAIAQTNVLNNNKTGIKWQQIKTEDFRILYPQGFEEEAQRMANTLELVHDPIDRSLRTNTRPVSILLQNRTSVANGFVTLGPRRSEFFTSAPQDYNFLGTNDWLNTLATHEYRHLSQFNKSRTGFNKVFYYLFGENTQAAMANIAAPAWFWEGDATVIETGFTQSGRGRIPAFNRIYRANLLEGKRYNYNKQSLRSYKDFVPNQYVLGYHMVGHLRKKTGDADVFAGITERAFGIPFIPFTFSNALKNKTGKYVVTHYEEMMDELEHEWRDQLNDVETTSFERITRRRNDAFTDYSYPAQMANGKLFIVKSGIGEIDQFMIVSENGFEERLFTPGLLNNTGMFSVAQNTVVWNEYAFDARWRNQSYSVIKLYDQNTNKLKTLSKKSRYHGAYLSPDAKEVATIEALENGAYRLVILDASTGEITKIFSNATQGLLTLPAWSSDGKKVTFLSNVSGKKSVQVINVASEEETSLIPAGVENIGNPWMHNEYLFYQSDYSGIDNIYALNTATGQKFQVTSSKYGAYNFSLSNDQRTIYYNDHSVNGLDVVSMPFDPNSWELIEEVEQNKVGYFKLIEEQESHSHILDSVPNKEYGPKKYSKLKGLINPHTWGPFVNTDDLNEVQIGVFSQDVLSTTSISAGYNYNLDNEDGAFVGRVSYQGFYPILDFEFSKGNRTDGSITWDERTIQSGVRVPLLLTKSKYHTELAIGNSVGYRHISNYDNGVNNLGRNFDVETTTTDGTPVRVQGTTVSELDNGTLLFNRVTIDYFHLLKQSTRDINSRFGQVLTLENFNSLSGDYVGGLTVLRGVLYFPGLFKHHSFYLRGGVQYREITDEPNLYAFGNRVFRPRGYDSYPNEKKSDLIQFNYTLPLWYPDLSFGPILNIKRIKANLFADIGNSDEVRYLLVTSIDDPSIRQMQRITRNASYSSFGAELTFDFNVMRFLPELELGVRYVYASAVPDLGFVAESKVEFIIGNISF